MKLKKLSLIYILMALSIGTYSQDDKKVKPESNIRLQVSAEMYTNRWMQWDNYISAGKDAYPQSNDIIPGFTIELYTPSKIKNVNYLIGTTFLRYNNDIQSANMYKYINENQLTGGGAFIGAEFSPRYRFIGISIKMAMGYFNLDRTIIKYSANPLDTYNVENHISSGSWGNILQISLNAKFGRFYLTPSAKLMMAGGDKMSVIAPGMSLGMGYSFK